MSRCLWHLSNGDLKLHDAIAMSTMSKTPMSPLYDLERDYTDRLSGKLRCDDSKKKNLG